MDSTETREKYYPLLRSYAIPIILIVFGLIFLAYGVIGYLGGKNENPDILFEAASTSDLADRDTPSEKQKMIVVDIEGAVQKPGVYSLPVEARLQDGLIAAGGLSKEADREKVARNLNLASRLTDGAKIYIPYKGESVLGGESSSLININSATESQLDILPGIGEVTAEKIITNRPYGAISELVEKKIVGKKVFDDIKDKITVF